MKIIAHIYIYWIGCAIIAAGQLLEVGGMAIVKPESKWTAWSDESKAIIKYFRDAVKPPEDARVELLFVAVKLGLNDSVREKGAALNEFAFVYVECKNDYGLPIRNVTVMTRSPYLDRQWMAESVNIIEGKEPLGNVLVLNDTVDIYTQMSQYMKRIIPPSGSIDHIIAMIVFEKAFVDVIGRGLSNEEILDLTKEPAKNR